MFQKSPDIEPLYIGNLNLKPMYNNKLFIFQMIFYEIAKIYPICLHFWKGVIIMQKNSIGASTTFVSKLSRKVQHVALKFSDFSNGHSSTTFLHLYQKSCGSRMLLKLNHSLRTNTNYFAQSVVEACMYVWCMYACIRFYRSPLCRTSKSGYPNCRHQIVESPLYILSPNASGQLQGAVRKGRVKKSTFSAIFRHSINNK
jgi:hypothetical protein